MTSVWENVKLECFLTHRKEFITLDDFSKYKRARVQLHGKGIVLRDRVYGSDVKTKRQQVSRAGDFLVAEIDAKVGGFGIVPPELDKAIVSSHYFLFELNDELCLRSWLDWFVRSGLLEEQVTARGSTNYAAIRPNDVLNFEIPLPPLDEQRRIVERIEALAARVREAQRLRDQVDNELYQLIVSLHLKEAGVGTVALGEILELDEETVGIYPDLVYPQVGIKAFGQGMFFRENLIGSNTKYKWFNRMYDGAVVLSQVKGWEGAVAVCPSTLVGYYSSPEYRTFRCKQQCCVPSYLSVLFSTEWFFTKLSTLSRGVGGRRERLRPEAFMELKIPMPDVRTQLRLQTVFAKIKQAVSYHSKTQNHLDTILPSILDKAFKGEL